MAAISLAKLSTPEMLAQLRDIAPQGKKAEMDVGGNTSQKSGQSFVDLLQDGIKEVNNTQKIADKKASDIATGKSGELHEAMLSASQAELTFNLMVQIRNKALEAYQDIMRMPV